MSGGYTTPLYVLAFDHRGSFQKKFFGIAGVPDEAETQRIADAKSLIWEGFCQAVDRGAVPDGGAVLVDEQFGAQVARAAKQRGVLFAMPVEKTGQDEFDFDYGDNFGAHIETFDPTFVKVLVRYNPNGDAALNARQTARLQRLSDWLAARGRKFLFELLVPAEAEQLERVGGDVGRYDRELRPSLMDQTIAAMQTAGVEPDIWKIEGIDDRADCERIAARARAGGRDQVSCVVLGRGADQAAVEQWLRTGAGVPGYIGFAIGRTIWWDALKAFVDGQSERGAAARRIADTYIRMIEVYAGAAAR